MAYQALYRKWRPRTFASVVGQEDITETLKNAVVRGTVSHAYLFAGPRGTGKTSCAKILAKALNCTNLQDGEPCNQCENCQAADAGAMPDIIEIDAASNNGVDEIRAIRDKVKYAPTQGKYKVYIIDEVHMLSLGAFNALLKTLEEPPAHVVFILATTELQKVPATIISRTQRYRFKRINVAVLEKRMQYILEQEKIPYDEQALKIIAQVADGGMRDALSILDQLLSYEKGKINYQDALQLTGFAAQEQVEQILAALLAADSKQALTLAKQELDQGASVQNLLSELIDLATQVLLAKKSKTDAATLLTAELKKAMTTAANERLFMIIDLANQALTDLRYTNQQQIPLEVFLVKAGQTQAGNAALATLQTQVKQLQAQVEQLSQNKSDAASLDQVFHLDTGKSSVAAKKPATAAASSPAVKKPKSRPIKRDNNRQQVYHVLEQATKKDLQAIKDVWPDLQSILAVSQRALLDVLVPVAASPSQVVMKCKYTLWFEKAGSDSDFLEKVTAALAKFTKHDYEIVLVPDQDWLTVRADFVKSHKDELLARKKGAAEPAADSAEQKDEQKIIAKAQELFGKTVKIKK